jgi:arylsulfatase A-like enzyme
MGALHRRGLRENTLFIFTSDNGYMLGEHGLMQKGFAYEPSIRLPLVMRWPGHIRAGSRSDALALNVDLCPTILQACGVALPDDVQGRSLLPAAEGAPEGWPREFLHLAPWFRDDGTPLELALAGDRWKYVRFRVNGIEEALYDLERDPGERTNLAADPAFAGELEGARSRLQEQMRALGVPAAWFTAPGG